MTARLSKRSIDGIRLGTELANLSRTDDLVGFGPISWTRIRDSLADDPQLPPKTWREPKLTGVGPRARVVTLLRYVIAARQIREGHFRTLADPSASGQVSRRGDTLHEAAGKPWEAA